MFALLVINPGSTSTKVAYYENDREIWRESISYSKEKLDLFESATDQFEMRLKDIEICLEKNELDVTALTAVVGRGGPFKSLESGTYIIDEAVLTDILEGNVQADHISNIGSLLAFDLALKAGNKPAYFVDPVSVDEFEPLARLSGLPDLERKSLLHALNVKATAHEAAKDIGKSINELNLIVAHLGGGISICPIQKGRIIDVNNANEGGPFSPERTGGLPSSSLVKMCFSGEFTFDEMKKKVVGNGGVNAYLGTNNMDEVIQRIEKGNRKASLVLEGMAYQIAKEIGSMATVLKGKIDAILITGGMAHQKMLVELIMERIGFLAPVKVYAGENEMQALAMGALRVLNGEENHKIY